jgi:hypothetical protein
MLLLSYSTLERRYRFDSKIATLIGAWTQRMGESLLPLMGPAGLGLVVGWLAIMVARKGRDAFYIGWRLAVFAMVVVLATTALSLFHLGLRGVLLSLAGLVAGVLTAAGFRETLAQSTKSSMEH